jgi:hypothetical protein
LIACANREAVQQCRWRGAVFNAPKGCSRLYQPPLTIAAFICSKAHPSPSGIFILDNGVCLVAKRIEIKPSTASQMLRISRENSAFSSYQGRIDEVHIIGRVVCFAGRL